MSFAQTSKRNTRKAQQRPGSGVTFFWRDSGKNGGYVINSLTEFNGVLIRVQSGRVMVRWTRGTKGFDMSGKFSPPP